MAAAAPYRLETCACPLCGEPPPAKTRVEFGPYRVVDCRSCSMRYLTPRVEESDVPRLYGSEDYWEKGGSEGGYSSYASMAPLLVRTFVRRLSRLARPARGARLLDVGCGPGAGLEAANALGYEAWGLDVSESAVNVASSRYPGRVRLGTLSDRVFSRGSFDVITLFDVIEHVYDPRALAVDLAWHLAPEGRVVVATPNVKSLLARVTGRRWVSYKIPEHVLYFSPRTLAEALAPGFEIEDVSSCGQYVSGGFLLSRIGDALPFGGSLLRAASRLLPPPRRRPLREFRLDARDCAPESGSVTGEALPDLSLVLPVFNAARFVERNLADVDEFLGRGALSWEIVAVDDGSTDGTAERLAASRAKNLRIVSLPENMGKFGALKAGMLSSRGRCRVFTDADLPFDLDAVPYMARLVNDRGFHIVTGDRTLAGSDYRPHVSRHRDAASVAFSFLVRMLVTGGLFDTQCGLKAFRSDVADALFPLLEENGFAGDVELLYIALKYNLEIKRVPVRLRRSGPSTVHLGLDSLRMLGHIASLRRAWGSGRYRSPALERIGEQAYWTSEAPAP